jgi:hypothetical protein
VAVKLWPARADLPSPFSDPFRGPPPNIISQHHIPTSISVERPNPERTANKPTTMMNLLPGSADRGHVTLMEPCNLISPKPHCRGQETRGIKPKRQVPSCPHLGSISRRPTSRCPGCWDEFRDPRIQGGDHRHTSVSWKLSHPSTRRPAPPFHAEHAGHLEASICTITFSNHGCIPSQHTRDPIPRIGLGH